MRIQAMILGLIGLLPWASARAAEECEKGEAWDAGMAMCMPIPAAGKTVRSLSVRANAFGAYVTGSGPRGKDAFAAPNWVMADLGTSAGERHYFNLDFMGTAEKWTFPRSGYPLLGQIGEHDENGAPFIDSQHPHSSPIMGLTLSDTIALGDGEGRSLKLSFAPRGESIDGPIAFMHRSTGEVNPDAPLGHHLGQDAGHISSTVFAAGLGLGTTRIEASAFHGAEPEPTKVDLPMGSPDSYSLRLSHDFSSAFTAMASAAYVKNPEHDDPTIPFVARYSASAYSKHSLGTFRFENTFILGMIAKYDHVPTLFSVGEEFLLRDESANSIFGRFEFIQRTADELAIPSSTPDEARPVYATTLGYTRSLVRGETGEVGLGVSGTHLFLPAEFRGAYDGDPWSGKVFLRITGMKAWDL
ncbi:MAG: hypothetical protein JST04_10665 [Bdellovibrionales bacterium]|nr:hypothetical protein [Bdellovibrionales bacterium]